MSDAPGWRAWLSPAYVWRWLRSPEGQKAVRYGAVSVVSTVVAQAVFLVSFGLLQLASAVWCQFLAAVVSAFPSYYLNRRWVWGKSGRSHLWKEVVPFWVIAVAGLVLSLLAVDLASGISNHYHFDHAITTVFADVMSLGSYGVVWLGKYWILNRYLFLEHAGTAS